MREKVRTSIIRQRLFSDGDTVVVAVSGGGDSVALLDILATLDEPRLRLVLAHLNHGLRGSESDGDEAFVCRLAEDYRLPVEVSRVDVAHLARTQRMSLEEAGRFARYRFFAEVADRYGAAAIATAHHADDQAETVLMRLLRGSGGTGLRAMPQKGSGNVVRPLLAITRREVEAYLLARELPCRTDSSNEDTGFLRNRIRHELIPVLETYNPRVSERLAATADALARDEEVLESVTDAAFGRHGQTGSGTVALDVPGCLAEPAGVRYRLYRRAVLLARGSLARVGAVHLREIDRIAAAPQPHLTLSLPDGTLVSKSYGVITFSLGQSAGSIHPTETMIDGTGEYTLHGGFSLVVTEARPPASWGDMTPHTAFFDVDAAPFPWRVRTFRPGDRLTPLGMTGRKKVKDVFIDARVPLAQRRRTPLLFCGERLLWVAGVCRSGEACLSDLTRRVVRAEIVDAALSIGL